MKLALSLGALSGANILLATLTQWYIVVTIGPGSNTDAYFASLVIPQLLLGIIAGSLGQVIVPLLAGERDDHILIKGWQLAILFSALFAAIALATSVSSRFWVPLLFHGFSEAGKALTIGLTGIQMLTMVLAALSSVLTAVHQAKQKFVCAASPSVLGDLVGLGALLLTLRRYGIVAAAWTLVLAAGLQTLLLLPGLGIARLRPLSRSLLKETWHRMKPMLFGSAYYKSDFLVDRFLSSMVPAGGFSLFYLGQQMYAAANQMIHRALVVPIIPTWAGMAKINDRESFARLYRKRLAQVAILTCCGYLLFLAIGKQALQVLIGHGAVTEENVVLLWQIMVALVGVFVGGGLSIITTSAFYARGDTRTPTKIGVWSFTVYAPLKVFAFVKFGLLGLAIATSAFFVVNLMMQLRVLRRVILQ
jgi:putative peptidoglycan lipid II flippase